MSVNIKGKLKKCNILGVDINVTDMKKTIEVITENLEEIRGNYICVSNVHTTIMAYEDKEYKKIQNQALMALPDGGPLSTLSKQIGFKEAQRVTGPDLMEKIFEISEENGYSHYFYGSTQETLEKLEKKLKKKYPKIKIAGIYSPPFRKITNEEDAKIIGEICKSEADFIWVGLGAPKQEIWMYEHRKKVNGVMIGVGAGFDYYAENIKRAPRWMQKNNLEWLFRLAQEPKRLLKRYLVTNIKFLYLICRKNRTKRRLINDSE